MAQTHFLGEVEFAKTHCRVLFLRLKHNSHNLYFKMSRNIWSVKDNTANLHVYRKRNNFTSFPPVNLVILVNKELTDSRPLNFDEFK